MTTTTDTVWSGQDATPSEIEEAVRALEADRHREEPGTVSTRVLNLVVVVERAWRGEIANRLGRLGRYHPSRTIVCAVQDGRTTIDAVATLSAEATGASTVAAGEVAPAHETIALDIGPRHLPHLASIVDPLAKPGVPTVAWAPHGHHEAVRALLEIAQIALVDSVADPAPPVAIRRALALSAETYVVDLAWLRSTPWRERIAATFDPPERRAALDALARVEIRHHHASLAAALLLAGWLASRLHWEPAGLVRHESGARACLRARRDDVVVELRVARDQDVPGLSGLTLTTADGASLALDRAPGGLRATREGPGGEHTRWTLLGASRGESGILGEGIRQALLRDPTYLPALRVAERLVA